jgi:hypothetical protein
MVPGRGHKEKDRTLTGAVEDGSKRRPLREHNGNNSKMGILVGEWRKGGVPPLGICPSTTKIRVLQSSMNIQGTCTVAFLVFCMQGQSGVSF